MQNLFQVPFLKEKALILFVYFLFAAIISSYHTYFIHLADTFQYLVIAENYSKGNFAEAINSYWSPLFSWLLAGFLKIGIEPFPAIQLLQTITGGFSLMGIFILIPLKQENKVLLLLLHCSFAILILSFAFLVATPDLLLFTITIGYLIFMSRSNFYLNNKFSFFVSGLIGAILYFSKAAGFIFFLLSFAAVNAIWFLKKAVNRKQLIFKYCFSIVFFLALSSIWVFLISKKENKFLISSAPEYNFSLIGPASNPSVWGYIHHPYEWIGLIPPTNHHSLNAWEAPNKMFLENWSLFDSKENVFHFLKIILRNLWSVQSFFFGFDSGTILTLGIVFLLIVDKKEVKNIFSDNMFPIIISISCTLPYIFVLIMERHVWINNIVMGILAVSVFEILRKNNKRIAVLFLLAFIALTAYKPTKELLTFHNDYTTVFAEKKNLAEYISGNTASILTKDEIPDENYTKSSIINYLSHSQYFGMICVPEQNKSMSDELKKYQIKNLLSWNIAYSIPDSLYVDAFLFPKSGVKVYKLK